MSNKKKLSLQLLIEECQRRKIFQGISIYALVSWVIIQVAATTFPYLGISEIAVTAVIVLALIGFPISLIFIWYYNRSSGPKEQGSDQEDLEQIEVGNDSTKLFKVIVSVISITVLLITVLLLRNLTKDNPIQEEKSSVRESIAILDFEDFTGQDRFAQIGKAAADWLSHGIVENKLGRVISTDILKQYDPSIAKASVATNLDLVKRRFAPAKIIQGQVFHESGNIILKCVINDGATNESLFAFEDIVVADGNPLEGIDQLKQKMLSYLATESIPEMRLQKKLPDYQAYLYTLQSYSTDDNRESLALVEKALAIDSNYFEAKGVRISFLYNLGEFETADSLLQRLSPDSNNSRQNNLMNFYRALIEGKNGMVYETWKGEYNHVPFSLVDNQTMMTIASQFVHRPEEVRDLFTAIDMNEMNSAECLQCAYRLYTMASADIVLKNYSAVIDLIEPEIKNFAALGEEFLIRPLIPAYIRSSDDEGLEQLMITIAKEFIGDSWKTFHEDIAQEYLLLDKVELAEPYLAKAEDYYEGKTDTSRLAQIHIMKGDFSKARKLFEEYSRRSIRSKATLAICYFKLGDQAMGKQLIKQIDEERDKYDLGYTDYVLAQIYGYIEEYENCFDHLKKSVEKGERFTLTNYYNDLAFKSIRDLPRFQEILQYWH